MARFPIDTTPEQDAAITRWIERENRQIAAENASHAADRARGAEGVLVDRPLYTLASFVQDTLSHTLNQLVRREDEMRLAAVLTSLREATPAEVAQIEQLLKEA